MGSAMNGMVAARRRSSLRQHLPGLLRLHEARDPAGLPDEAAGDLHLHPRFDRAGRRRTDPPADRAPGRAPRDAQHDGHPPGRRERNGDGVARRAGAHHRTHRTGADPAEASGAGSRGAGAGRRRATRRLRAAGAGHGARRRSSSPPAPRCSSRSRPPSGWAREGIAVRVVSLPSWEIFRRQPQAYRDQVLPPSIRARVSVEALVAHGLAGVDHRGRRGDRHRPLRRFGAGGEAVQGIRIHDRRGVAAVRRTLARRR